ncbi:hypothetical protein BCR39DRAFT_507302 [Naematelia encephala]|uniref:Uncharacterized protein n=1 Tax=Naematelia encephala TaxID=71784 RepID=A0A1Y2AQP5_9TREE|nr:hypothetical protein BCR39DRAFT_507302 [Naematelia encephala]
MPSKAISLLPMYTIERHMDALDPLIHSILLVLFVTAFTSAAFVFAAGVKSALVRFGHASLTIMIHSVPSRSLQCPRLVPLIYPSIIGLTIVLDLLAVWSAVDPFSTESSRLLERDLEAHSGRTKRQRLGRE